MTDLVLFVGWGYSSDSADIPALLKVIGEGADMAIGSCMLGRIEHHAMNRSATLGNRIGVPVDAVTHRYSRHRSRPTVDHTL